MSACLHDLLQISLERAVDIFNFAFASLMSF